MTNVKEYTKETITTLSAADLLASWTSGQGATGKLEPEEWAHVEAGKIQGIEVSLDFMTALLESKSRGALPSHLEAWRKGYLSPNHQSQYESGTGSKATKPDDTFVSTKANITSEVYLHNCIKLGLSADNVPTISDLLESYWAVTDKTTKADMLLLLSKFAYLFCDNDQHQVYDAKRVDEEEAAKRFALLIEHSFEDIRSMSAPDRYVANLPTSKLGNIGILSEAGFILVGTQAINAELYQITFKSIDAEAK